MEIIWSGIRLSDDMVVEPSDWIPEGEWNPHRVRPYLILAEGSPICIVFASYVEEAIDIAVDANRLDAYIIDIKDPGVIRDYLTEEKGDSDCSEMIDGKLYWWKEEPLFAGNASEPLDGSKINVLELPNPKKSWIAQFKVEYDNQHDLQVRSKIAV